MRPVVVEAVDIKRPHASRTGILPVTATQVLGVRFAPITE
jgi:hypothetical protein